MGEDIGQRGNPAHPRGADDRRGVLADDAHLWEAVLRDRRAVAHLLDVGTVGDGAGEQQREGAGVVRGVAGFQFVGGHFAFAVEATADLHQLRGALGFPAGFLFAHQLHPHRAPDRLGEQGGIGGHVVGAVASVATRGLHAVDLYLLRRASQQQGDVLAQVMGVLAAGPDLGALGVDHRHRAGRADGGMQVIGPDIVDIERAVERAQAAVDAGIVAQHAILLGVGQERFTQDVRPQVGQRVPGFPLDLELAHGVDGLLLALGDYADKVTDHHQFDDARQVRDGRRVHRDQCVAQWRAGVGAGVGRAYHAAVEHAVQAQVVDIGQLAGDLGRDVHARGGLADITTGADRLEFDARVQGQVQVLPAGQFGVAQASCRASADVDLSALDPQPGNRLVEDFRRAFQQPLAQLGGGLAQGQGADLEGRAGDGRALVRGSGGVAEDHPHLFEIDIQFVGDDLCQRGAYPGAEIDMTAERGDVAVGVQGDKTVDVVRRRVRWQCARVKNLGCGQQGFGQQGADHDQAAGLEQAATGQRQVVHGRPRSASSWRARAAACRISKCAPQRQRL